MLRKGIIIAAVLVTASTAVAAPTPNFTPVVDRPTWNSRLFHRAQMSGCQTCQYEFGHCEWRCNMGNFGGYMTYNQCLNVCAVAVGACMANFC